MQENSHLIWSSDFDFTEDMKEDLIERLGEGLNDDALFAIACQEHADTLDDEKSNLSTVIPADGIFAVARLGLWNGSPLAILPEEKVSKLVSAGDCIQSYVRGMSNLTAYVDSNGDFRIDETHHDGTNQYLFRAWKPGATYDQKDELMDAAYSGCPVLLSILLERYTTRMGDDIGKIYGWDFPEPKAPVI